MFFIDSHSHLNDESFNDDREAVIDRMKAAGLSAAIVVACTESDLPLTQSLLAAHPGYLFGAWALHPEYKDETDPTIERIIEVCSAPQMVAVGETGLDYYWCKEPLDWQRRRFRTHIEAARAIGKPLIVHARDAEKDAVEILRETHAGDVGFVLHCYSSDTDTALAAVDAGGLVSFTGSLTFKRNDALRDVARALPLEKIMLETDCPYMAPVPFRGKRCEPTYIPQIGQCLADVKGVTLAEVARVTTATAERFFKLPVHAQPL